MKHAYLALTALMLAIFVPAVAANAATRTEFMPCAQEDSTNCVWDAKHMGNGDGHSFFTTKSGKVIRLPHSIAHALIFQDLIPD